MVPGENGGVEGGCGWAKSNGLAASESKSSAVFMARLRTSRRTGRDSGYASAGCYGLSAMIFR
jgi:hypothetical protein